LPDSQAWKNFVAFSNADMIVLLQCVHQWPTMPARERLPTMPAGS
jgi:hypothetical protein